MARRNAASARPGMLMAARDLLAAQHGADRSRGAAMRSAACCAAAPATRRSSTPCWTRPATAPRAARRRRAPATAVGARAAASVDGAAKLDRHRTLRRRRRAGRCAVAARGPLAARQCALHARRSRGASRATRRARGASCRRADVPGRNGFGIIPTPQGPAGARRGRWCASAARRCAALLGARAALDAVRRMRELPIAWEPLPAVLGLEAALAQGAHRRCRPASAGQPAARRHRAQRRRRGRLRRSAPRCAEGRFRTGFVEHAYIEPEAG